MLITKCEHTARSRVSFLIDCTFDIGYLVAIRPPVALTLHIASVLVLYSLSAPCFPTTTMRKTGTRRVFGDYEIAG